MKSKSVCQSVLESLLKDGTENLSDEISSHLADCDKCRSEYEKLKKTSELISASAPAVPDLRRSVIEKINSENIAINKMLSSHRRRHIPLGTIAAAAAIIAVYVSVYGTKLPNMVYKEADKTDGSIQLSDNITEAPDVLMNSAVPSSGGSENAENGLIEKGSDIYYYETADKSQSAEKAAEYDADSDDMPEKDPSRQSAAGGSGAGYADNSLKTGENINKDCGNESSDIYKSKSGYITKGRDILTSYPTMNVLGFISGSETDKFSDSCGGDAQKPEGTDDKNEIKSLDGNVEENRCDSQNYEELKGEEIFEIMSREYPDRISYEAFETVGGEIYKAFVMSLKDFETEYTEAGLLEYSQGILHD